MGKQLAQNVLVLVITIVVVTAVLELAIRVVYPQNTCNGAYDNTLRVSRFLPNVRCTFIGYTHEFRTSVKANVEGFYDHPYPRERNTLPRIVIIGDSMVEGLQVPLDATLSKQLEQRFRNAGTPVEIIAMGVSAATTESELLMLEDGGMAYAPDIMVIGFFFGNDVLANYRNTAFTLDNGTLRRELVNSTERPFLTLKKFFRRNFHLYDLLVDTVRKFPKLFTFFQQRGIAHAQQPNIPAYDMPIFGKRYTEDTYAAWEESFALIKVMREHADTIDAQVVLFAIPAAFQVDRGKFTELMRQTGLDPAQIEVEKPNALLAEFAEQQNITLIDPLPLFRELNGNNSFYWRIDDHFNAAGNALAAETLFTALQPLLQKNGIVPERE